MITKFTGKIQFDYFIPFTLGLSFLVTSTGGTPSCSSSASSAPSSSSGSRANSSGTSERNHTQIRCLDAVWSS